MRVPGRRVYREGTAVPRASHRRQPWLSATRRSSSRPAPSPARGRRWPPTRPTTRATSSPRCVRSGSPRISRSTPRTDAVPSTRGRTRHPGYGLSQRARRRVEEIFGWLKTVALVAADAPPRTRAGRLDVCLWARRLQPDPHSEPDLHPHEIALADGDDGVIGRCLLPARPFCAVHQETRARRVLASCACRRAPTRRRSSLIGRR